MTSALSLSIFQVIEFGILPRVPECQHVILQWQAVTPGTDEFVMVKGKRRLTRNAPTIAWRAEFVRVGAGCADQRSPHS